MPIISTFGLDGNHVAVDYFKLSNLLDISRNIKILSPFDIKGKARTNIFSPLVHVEMHYTVHGPPQHMYSLQK